MPTYHTYRIRTTIDPTMINQSIALPAYGKWPEPNNYALREIGFLTEYLSVSTYMCMHRVYTHSPTRPPWNIRSLTSPLFVATNDSIYQLTTPVNQRGVADIHLSAIPFLSVYISSRLSFPTSFLVPSSSSSSIQNRSHPQSFPGSIYIAGVKSPLSFLAISNAADRRP